MTAVWGDEADMSYRRLMLKSDENSRGKTSFCQRSNSGQSWGGRGRRVLEGASAGQCWVGGCGEQLRLEAEVRQADWQGWISEAFIKSQFLLSLHHK